MHQIAKNSGRSLALNFFMFLSLWVVANGLVSLNEAKAESQASQPAESRQQGSAHASR